MTRNSEVREYQAGLRKKLKESRTNGGPPLEQEEISVLVDQFQIDQFEASQKKRPRHRHRWSKPRVMSTVGMVKTCRAPGCPKRTKAVKPWEVK